MQTSGVRTLEETRGYDGFVVVAVSCAFVYLLNLKHKREVCLFCNFDTICYAIKCMYFTIVFFLTNFGSLAFLVGF